MATTTIPLHPTGKSRRVVGTVRPFDGVELPYAVIEGKTSGPCLLITAGVHGAEVCGIETARRIFANMPPEQINGTLVVLPTLNMQGLKQHSIFVMPEDGENLNRQFPGKPDGTESQRLAHWLVKEIYPHAGAYIDLHSGDLTEDLTPFTLFVKDNAKSQDLATAFGLPITVQGGNGGYTVNGASNAGLPGIVAEVGSGGRWSQQEVLRMSEGIARVMKHLGMLVHPSDAGELSATDARGWNSIGMLVAPVEEPPKAPLIVTAKSLAASCDGYWYPDRKPGDKVKAGDKLGQIQDIQGNAIGMVIAEKAGIYLYGSTSLWVAEGEVLSCIATPIEE